ncbi:FecCD family ABC transporter permease [Corynebacterium bovis]|uniref:FecCD family ABC transporter permease n=1 Tax=Corynebacterium bovis TaxID=36808 RepID=UPI00313A4829
MTASTSTPPTDRSPRAGLLTRHIREARVPGRPALRLGPVSTVWRPWPVAVTLILAVAAVFLFGASIGLGDYPLSVWKVLRVLFTGDGTRIERLVVLDWRMPRAVTGLAVGAALGLSGALTQSVTRNSLASPDILGITKGASAAAATVIILGSGGGLAGWLASVGTPVAALLGAVATALVIWLLAARRGADPFRLVLFGIIVSALLEAYISYLLTTADTRDAATAQMWLTGSLGSSTWQRTLPISLLVVVCVPVTAWIAFRLLASLLGPDTATALGQNTRATQVVLLGLSVALAAVAVAASGPIGFVAFVAPQVALRLTRVAAPPLVASALTGAVLLIGADIITQSLLPVELPVGLLTSAVGGVFLIHLLVRNNRRTTT